MIFRTTKGDDERQLRSSNSSVSILSLQKNGVHFTTAKLAAVAEQLKEVEAEYKTKQSFLVAQVAKNQQYIEIVYGKLSYYANRR